MDERKRLLATAWRDLAGWSVGMIDTDGEVCDGRVNWEEDEGRLPDPDAPANWGVWLAWVWRNTSGHVRLDADGDWWCAQHTPESRKTHTETLRVLCPAHALLTLVCMVHERSGLPPSVTAWWEAEQEDGEKGDHPALPSTSPYSPFMAGGED